MCLCVLHHTAHELRSLTRHFEEHKSDLCTSRHYITAEARKHTQVTHCASSSSSSSSSSSCSALLQRLRHNSVSESCVYSVAPEAIPIGRLQHFKGVMQMLLLLGHWFIYRLFHAINCKSIFNLDLFTEDFVFECCEIFWLIPHFTQIKHQLTSCCTVSPFAKGRPEEGRKETQQTEVKNKRQLQHL